MRSSPLRLLSCLVAVWLWCAPAAARELAVDPAELIPVELATVALAFGTDIPVVLLREPASGDVVPIFIGVAEARAILLALRGVEMPRPMTHDLLHDVIGKLSGTLERVVVDELRNGTYFGALEVRVAPGGALVRIDARPSDALALAVRAKAEILVARAVLQAGRGLEFEGLAREQVVTALGITVVEATDELREALDLPAARGVVVTAASGPAAYAGLRPGTLIVEVNGEVPENPMGFLELVRKTPAGQRASVVYLQDGEAHRLELPTDVPARRQPAGVVL
jgi:bifunctional DNase/RNase